MHWWHRMPRICPGAVVMIKGRSHGRAATNGARVVLRSQERLELGRGDAVQVLSCGSCAESAGGCSSLPFLLARPTVPLVRSQRPVGVTTFAKHLSRSRLRRCEGIPVCPPPLSVFLAPAQSLRSLRAAFDRARWTLSNPSAPGCLDGERVTVRPPTDVVLMAPSAHFRGSRTIGNATGRRIGLHQGDKPSLVWPAVVQGNRRLHGTGGRSRCR